MLKMTGDLFDPKSEVLGRKGQMELPSTWTCACSLDDCNQESIGDGVQCPNVQMMLPSTDIGKRNLLASYPQLVLDSF